MVSTQVPLILSHHLLLRLHLLPYHHHHYPPFHMFPPSALPLFGAKCSIRLQLQDLLQVHRKEHTPIHPACGEGNYPAVTSRKFFVRYVPFSLLIIPSSSVPRDNLPDLHFHLAVAYVANLI